MVRGKTTKTDSNYHEIPVDAEEKQRIVLFYHTDSTPRYWTIYVQERKRRGWKTLRRGRFDSKRLDKLQLAVEQWLQNIQLPLEHMLEVVVRTIALMYNANPIGNGELQKTTDAFHPKTLVVADFDVNPFAVFDFAPLNGSAQHIEFVSTMGATIPFGARLAGYERIILVTDMSELASTTGCFTLNVRHVLDHPAESPIMDWLHPVAEWGEETAERQDPIREWLPPVGEWMEKTHSVISDDPYKHGLARFSAIIETVQRELAERLDPEHELPAGPEVYWIMVDRVYGPSVYGLKTRSGCQTISEAEWMTVRYPVTEETDRPCLDPKLYPEYLRKLLKVTPAKLDAFQLPTALLVAFSPVTFAEAVAKGLQNKSTMLVNVSLSGSNRQQLPPSMLPLVLFQYYEISMTIKGTPSQVSFIEQAMRLLNWRYSVDEVIAM